MAKQIIIEDINEVNLHIEKVDEVVLDFNNVHYLGYDPFSDDAITSTNIDTYKIQDVADILQNGGELATDEEYAVAEAGLQKMYSKIMGVENE